MLPFFSSISGEISIMNSLRKFVSSVKVLAVTLVLLLSFFSSAAMADEATCIVRGPITIENGSFDYSKTRDVNEFTVRSAIVSLPVGESGTIDSIKITGPDGKPELGCPTVKDVKNGTDLIPACGGPVVLKTGETIYAAKGSDCGPNGNIKSFKITLCDDFS